MYCPDNALSRCAKFRLTARIRQIDHRLGKRNVAGTFDNQRSSIPCQETCRALSWVIDGTNMSSTFPFMSTLAAERLPRSITEQKAEKLLKDAGVDGQFPVPLESISLFLGFEPVGFSPQDEARSVSGMIDYAAHKIYVNTSESLQRQRFTLAHEIAHAYLHAPSQEMLADPAENAIVDYRVCLDNPSTPKEVEANAFAAALLMPRESFVRMWYQYKGNLESLCTAFGASKQAVEIRASTLIRI